MTYVRSLVSIGRVVFSFIPIILYKPVVHLRKVVQTAKKAVN